VEVEGHPAHVATAAPDAVAIAPEGATLVMLLATWGFTLTTDVASAVDAAVAAGDELLVLRFTPAVSSTSDVRTRTVRITETGPLAFSSSLSGLSLTGGGASSVDVTAFAIGGSRTEWGETGSTSPLAIDPSTVLWLAAGGSTYPAVRDSLLRGHPGAWLEETAGHGVLFQSASVPGGPPAPATAGGYFLRANAYGDATGDSATCSVSVGAVAASTATVSVACAPGRLAVAAPASPCQETVGTGEIAADVLRCGGVSDDLALALSGLAPASATLTRARSLIPAGVFGQDAPLQPVARADRGPVVTAAGYSPACEGNPDGGAAGTSGGGGGGVTLAPWTGAGTANVGATTNDPGDPGTGDPGLGNDNTSADSSGDDSSDSCSGDPSPKDSSQDSSSSSEGCSCGDSTGSGSGGGGGGGESGDSSGGDSCGSGSSSGGGGGDSCGSGSGSSNCSTSGSHSHRRAPVSRVLLSLAMIAAVARRRGTRARRESTRATDGDAASVQV
jgi:hypothetical protein